MLQKGNILQNWHFCNIFAFISEAHITKMQRLLKQIVIFLSKFTIKLLLKPNTIFLKFDNKINTYVKKKKCSVFPKNLYHMKC